MNNHPKVSVIIATYNRAQYVSKTIDSALAQTYKDYEIIVIDDGSPDNTQEVLRKYDGRIRYIRQENKGVTATLNYGFSIARGEFIALLDDDDLWLPEKLEKQMIVIEKDPSLAFVCCPTYLMDGTDRITGHWKRKPEEKSTFDCLFDRNFVNHLTVLIRKKCLDAVGGYDPNLKCWIDYDLSLRLAKRYNFYYLDELLTKYREHETNFSKNLNITSSDFKKIFTKPEIIEGVGIFRLRKRIAKQCYTFAVSFQEAREFRKAALNYMKSLLMFPLVGMFYRPKETKNLRLTFPYRVFKVYYLTIYCFLKQLSIKK